MNVSAFWGIRTGGDQQNSPEHVVMGLLRKIVGC